MNFYELMTMIKEIAIVGISLIYLWDILKEIVARRNVKFSSKKSTQKLKKRIEQEHRLNSTEDNIPKEKEVIVTLLLAIVLTIFYFSSTECFEKIAEMATIVNIIGTAELTRIKNRMAKDRI